MANGPLGLEHPLIVADDLEALAARYEALGFALTPMGHHPWGTSNRLVVFPDSFLELLTVSDPSLLDEPGPSGFRFGRFIADQLGRREGIALIALHSQDVPGDAAAIAGRGLEPDGRADFSRDILLPDGSTGQVSFALSMLVDWEQPSLSHFLCQQQRPELFWRPERMQHPNGAHAIAHVVYAAAEPYAHWRRFAALWGEDALQDLGQGFSVATAGGELLVLDRPTAEARFAPGEMPDGWRDAPCAVALAIRVADLNTTHMLMMQNRVPHIRLAEAVRVPPAYAGNLILEFVP